MDISFKMEKGNFNYRAAGVIINKNRLLIMKDGQSPYYYIPGGRVLMNELSENAIIREIKEELNIEVKVNRMLWIHENIFHEEYFDEDFHELCIYYLIDIVGDEALSKQNEFTLLENGKQELRFFWKDFNEIKNLKLYPLFIKEKISQLPQSIEHVVENKINV
jgi:ADP-ribose pyrophosphatase YjhB (NUDIX family)